MPKQPLAFALAALGCLSIPLPGQGDRWFTVNSLDADLRRIDPMNAATLQSRAMSTTAGTIVGANGLAVHPRTGEVFVVLRLLGQSGRFLARLDVDSATATTIGQLGDNFASLAFDDTGTLFGVTGDGASVPETLFTIDLATGRPTHFLTLGNGDAGEAIGFHTPSGLLYHASGLGMPNRREVLETIDPRTRVGTNVPLSRGDWDEAQAIAHFAGDVMLAVDVTQAFWALSTTGEIDLLGFVDHFPKGLANVPATGGAYHAAYGFGSRAPSRSIPMLAARGAPAPGSTIVLQVRNGAPRAPALLTLGLGTQQFALTPDDVLQNLPLSGLVVPLALGTGGHADLPLPIPAGAPFDGWFQVGQLTGSELSLTNGLHVHVQ